MRVAGLAAVFALIAGMACAQAPLAGANDARCQAALAYSASHRGAAVLALKDGKPICEGYAGEGAADRPMELWSGAKSFVGLMAAAATTDIGRGPALPRDLVLAAGAFNRRLFVVPSKGLTIARLASMPPRDAARPTDPDARWSDAKFARFFTD
jgi:CubicO group peptidase (beta-lactamase class C family)